MIKITSGKNTFALLLFLSMFTPYLIEAQVLSAWKLTEIKASNIQHYEENELSNLLPSETILTNMHLIIQLASNSVALLNVDTLEFITHFKTRFALYKTPKYSPDGRFAYLVSNNGWISKYDIYNMRIVSEVKAGISTQSLALSNDGKYAIIGNDLPHNIVILNTENLSPIKVIETKNKKGISSRVSAVYNAPPRYSFIITLKDIKEVWEIPYSDKGGVEVFKGWAHDYRKDGGEGKIENWKSEGLFPIRRIKTEYYLDDFFFDPNYINMIGTARNNHNGQVINLDTKKKVATIELTGMPHLGSGITWDYQGKQVFASPNIKEGKLTVIEMENWQVMSEIKTEGSVFSLHSHNKSPYVWVEAFINSSKEKIHIIKKNNLDVVKTIISAPNKTASHIEFTKDGNYVLLNVWDNNDHNGAIIIYDANTLEEIKRLP